SLAPNSLFRPLFPIQSMSASTEFALGLLRAASGGDENFVISPFSLGAALAIVHDGAKEDTQEELTKLLGKDLSASEVSSLYSSLTSALSEKNAEVVTSVVNRFFLDKDFTLKSEYQTQVETAYKAGAENIDFNEADGSAKHVNSFVNDNTGGMIPELVTADSFADAVAILINAVYFKGAWKKPFEKDYTMSQPFHGIVGDRDDLLLIRDAREHANCGESEYLSWRFPYQDPAYSLVVLMPSGDFGEWRASLTTEQLHGAIDSLHKGSINLELPKFRIESSTDGKAALQKLGVQRIFGPDAKSPTSIAEGLKVSEIVHKAMIEVSEEGTEAAAATQVAMVEKMMVMSMAPVDLTFDCPFLYVLLKEDTVLFLG
ncbi:hypothetical protein PENTCL1PPCAC_14233, partial [Pristionchus entomophagus]